VADGTPNPYTAPQTALADGTADAARPVTDAREPPRAAAIIVALFGFPLGAGLYLLGLRRRFVVWAVTGLLAGALAIGSIRIPLPRLSPIALLLLIPLWLAALVATIRAKPGPTPVKFGAAWAVLLIALGLGVNAAVRHWLVEAFQMPSGSMIPTLLVGDHFFIRKGHAAARGDVIAFKFPMDTSTDYIKRVVAVGGDTIEVRDGVPFVNGVALEHEPIDAPCSFSEIGIGGEPETVTCKYVRETNAGRSYTILFQSDRPAADFPRTMIPPGQLFMLGDNRDNSYDSRRWGTVDVDLVKGKATVTWWSRGAGRSDIRWSRIGHGVE
jgi:signal peptidase I